MTDLLIKLFIKDSKNISNFKVRERYGNFASIVGIISNLLLFIIKITIGLIYNSIAITADAINNLSDSSSSLITMLGFKISGKPADVKHPYGHARMEYISGLIVSFIILMLGLELIKTSVNKIINPQSPQFSIVSVIVLVIAILLKLWQCLFYKKVGNIIKSTTIIASSMDSRNDILATSAVLFASIFTHFTGFNLDGYMGVVVALFILITGTKLIIDTMSPLLGTAPSRELVDSIYKKILSYDGIIGMHDLAIHSYGPGRSFASVHCEVPAEQDIMISHDIIDNIERDFLKECDIHMVIHLDPVVTNDERTNKLKAAVEKLVAEISPKISMHDFRVVWGVTHSNLIFDVVAPYDLEWSDDELIDIISEKIHDINDTYNAVITVDHAYVPHSALEDPQKESPKIQNKRKF